MSNFQTVQMAHVFVCRKTRPIETSAVCYFKLPPLSVPGTALDGLEH